DDAAGRLVARRQLDLCHLGRAAWGEPGCGTEAYEGQAGDSGSAPQTAQTDIHLPPGVRELDILPGAVAAGGLGDVEGTGTMELASGVPGGISVSSGIFSPAAYPGYVSGIDRSEERRVGKELN